MSWDGALASIEAHLVAAGAAVTPKITDVRHGEPKDIRNPQGVLAYWYAGDRDSQTGGNTLTKTNIEEGVRIQLYVPGSIRLRGQTDTVEKYLRAVIREVKRRLWADGDLGQADIIGLDIEGTETGWFEISGVEARSAGFTVWIDLPFVDDISP